MKKFLLCSLVAVIILSFAACGNSSNNKIDYQSEKQIQSDVMNDKIQDYEDKENVPEKVQGHGVHELVPEWVDGQEYPQGEDEPADNGTAAPVNGNQKEEPHQHNIASN